MRERLVAALSGALFAIGLTLSGMTRPAKVSGFLDVAGKWDPSLAWVMAGAVGIYFLAYSFHRRRAHLAAVMLDDPPSLRVDRRLVGGAALFGIGWGLSGFCPGPAFVSLGAGAPAALWFAPAMLAGMAVHRALEPRAVRSCG